MAWLLAGRELPEKPLTLDHLCWNKLCVRIDHLRVATPREQKMNTGLYKNSTSGVRGVSRHKGKWRVQVGHNGKEYFGGHFDNLIEAKAAYVALREQLHGV
jgi:hypothetical protein